MSNSIEIEDIEDMRCQAGIDDVELRAAIGRLAVGDRVKLTFLTDTQAFETLTVRITGITGPTFRGELVRDPTLAGLASLRARSRVTFTAAHIHSLPNQPSRRIE